MSAYSANVVGVEEDVVSVAGGVTSEQGRVDRLAMDSMREAVGEAAEDVADWLGGVGASGANGGSTSGDSDEFGGSAAVMAASVRSLKELSRRVERISKQQLAAKFKRARAPVGAQRRGGSVPMLQFSLSGTRTVTELETANGIYDDLNAEKRVVTMVAARTAIGKTTIFPSRLAVRCNRRVLLVEPDVRLVTAATSRQRSTVKVRTPWFPRRTAVLTAMSYEEFCGQFRSQSGADMLNSFDVIVFDEAHLQHAAVRAAKTIVASYQTNASLLVCSATFEDGDVQGTAAVKPTVRYTSTSLKQLADKGHLVGSKVGCDRTLVLATDDREVQYVAESIADAGMRVTSLDSASKNAELKRVKEFFDDETAIVNRYTVASPEFGVGHNFSTSNVVISGKKKVHVLSDDARTLEEKEVVCSKGEIAQMVGRANRGLVRGASALVCVAETEIPDKEEVSAAEDLRYYVLLLAAGIKPTRELNDRWKKLLPFSLNQRVACDILSVNMPVEVAIRFFASDGRVPFKYADALSAFSEDEHEFLVSEHEEPYGHHLWVEEPMSGYYDDKANESAPRLVVPCHATGNYRVMLHAICAAALGLLVVENWKPQLSDSDGSDLEEVKPGNVARLYIPRLVESASSHRAPSPLAIADYSYDVPIEKQFAARQRNAIPETSYSANILQALAILDTDTSQTTFDVRCGLEHFQDEKGVDRVGVQSVSVATPTVDVHSPGGTVVMSFRQSVWKTMVDGYALHDKDAKSFFHSIRHNVAGFVGSDALSGWTNVWFSVFRTAADPDNLSLVKYANFTSRVVALLLAMVRRYVSAVREVSRTSVIKSSVFVSMLRSNISYEEVYRQQSNRGRLEIAQSEIFIRRVFDIRTVMAEALMECEREDVFAPGVVTQVQEMLPLMKPTGVRVIDKVTQSRRFIQRLGF